MKSEFRKQLLLTTSVAVLIPLERPSRNESAAPNTIDTALILLFMTKQWI